MPKKEANLPLLQLQDKLKRDPESYKDEFLVQLRHFESTAKVFEMRPNEDNKKFLQLLTFICHCAPKYPQEAGHVPTLLMKLVDKHMNTMNFGVRRQIVSSIALLRGRDFVAPEIVLPFFFKLFRINDKELRKTLLTSIISDIKKINTKSKNQKVNSVLQGFMHKVLEEDDATAAQYSLIVMIDLYRRRIWTSDQAVNIIAKAVFSKHTKIMILVLKFFLGRYAKLSVLEVDKQEEDQSQGISDEQVGKRNKRALHNFKKARKKTRGQQHKMEKELAKIQKDRQVAEKYDTVFPAIEVLFDPQSWAEKLFQLLQKTHERFEVRLLIMQVLSKVISTHQLIVENYYPYLERYMEPFGRDVSSLLVVAVDAVHEMVPPETCTPLMMTIANHFITDKAEPDTITVGINTVREMCRRQPLLMIESLLHDISEYKSFKKDKGVSSAAKSVIYLYRELAPNMLRKKDRGKFHNPDNKLSDFGAPKANEYVDGVQLLYEAELRDAEEKDRLRREKIAARKADGLDSELGSEEEEEQDDGWGQVSEEEISDDDSGEWIDVSEDEPEPEEASDFESSSDEEPAKVRSNGKATQAKPTPAKPTKEDEEEDSEEDEDGEEDEEEEVEEDEDGWEELEEIEDSDEEGEWMDVEENGKEDTKKVAEKKVAEDADDDSDCPDLIGVAVGEDGEADGEEDEDEEEEDDDVSTDPDSESEEDEELLTKAGRAAKRKAREARKQEKKAAKKAQRQALAKMKEDMKTLKTDVPTSDKGEMPVDENEDGDEDEEIEEEDPELPTAEDLGRPLTIKELEQRYASDACERILTPKDFERIAELKQKVKQGKTAPSTLKRREKKADIMANLNPELIEYGTDKRKEIIKQEKYEKTLAMREKFKMKSKMESKGGGTTNKDKMHAKPTLLVRHKFAIKRKRTSGTNDRIKNKKKRIQSQTKFKIKRGK